MECPSNLTLSSPGPDRPIEIEGGADDGQVGGHHGYPDGAQLLTSERDRTRTNSSRFRGRHLVRLKQMDFYYAVLDVLRTSLLLVSNLMVFAGIAEAAFEALRCGPGRRVPRQKVEHIALGSEFYIGVSILNLILDPTWPAAAALIILTRRLITLTLNRLAREADPPGQQR